MSTVATNAASFIKNKLVGAFSSLVNVLKESIRAAQVQEDAINKLNSQLVISGTYTRRVSKEMQIFASRLQEVTRFGDEAILGQLAFAVAMGASNKQAQQIVTAAADMAEALNIDLNSAVRNIAKTLGGFAGELGEVIPELKNLTAEQLKAGEGVKLLADRFKGAAGDAVDSYSGRVSQLTNAYGDLTEQIGIFVTNSPIVIEVLKQGKKLFEDLGTVLVDNKKVFQDLVRDGILIAAKGLQLATEFTLALIVAYKKLNLLFGTSAIVRDIKELEIKQRFDEKAIENLKVRIRLTKDFDEIRDSVKEIKVIEKRLDLINVELKAKRDLLVTDSERFRKERTALVEISIQLNKFVKQLDKSTTQELDASKKKIKAKEAEEKSKLNAYKKRLAKEKAEDKKKQAADKKLAAQNLDATKSSLDTISTLTSSANSELFAIGKAGAVASATINGYEAVTKAFAIGGPLGFILGPLVALAVANQIHGILATPKPSFATGGVVPFTPGAVCRTRQCRCFINTRRGCFQ